LFSRYFFPYFPPLNTITHYFFGSWPSLSLSKDNRLSIEHTISRPANFSNRVQATNKQRKNGDNSKEKKQDSVFLNIFPPGKVYVVAMLIIMKGSALLKSISNPIFYASREDFFR
jgi:hypothetical protein